MPAFFCTKTGVRIIAPGICKDVDPVNGQDVYRESEAAPSVDDDKTTKPAKSGK